MGVDVFDAMTARLGDPQTALARRKRMDQNMRFAFSRLDDWRRLYPNQWIAVHDDHLVVAQSKAKLLRVLNEANIPIAETFVGFLNAEKHARFL
jgi:hypothetical protein